MEGRYGVKMEERVVDAVVMGRGEQHNKLVTKLHGIVGVVGS